MMSELEESFKIEISILNQILEIKTRSPVIFIQPIACQTA